MAPATVNAEDEANATLRAELDRRIERLESIKAIERLQYAYGYYQDRFFYREVDSLFADKAPAVQWGNAVWDGQKAVRAFWLDYWKPTFAKNTDGPVAGRMLDLPQWQGIITLGKDGETASARFRTIGRHAIYREKEFWISGFFQNDYVREDGVWKLTRLKFCPNWAAPYTQGWQDATEEGALAWLPDPPANARPTRTANAAERCPKPFPGEGTSEFGFETAPTGGVQVPAAMRSAESDK